MRLVYCIILSITFTSICTAQEEITLKNVSDTILNSKRTLDVTHPLDAVKTMQKLFPGKLYNLSDHNTFLSWKCKTCKPAAFTDVNGVEGDQMFPYQEGVATRLLDNINYVDSKGNEFKLLFFNHSVYDADGLQTGRFSGGLVGVAKFAKNNNVWQMRSFQPAIAAFGAFSNAPSPKLIVIGDDQYAFTLVHSNGGGGAPYYDYLYLIVGFNGKYQPLMEVDNYRLSNNGGGTNWASTYKVVNDNSKKYFRDFVITTTGSYRKSKGGEDEYEIDMPKEVSEMAKTKKQFDFVIERHYSFKGKWYNIVGQPTVKFSNVK